MAVAPLFKSHYSIGRSILTLEKESSENGGSDSIIDICNQNKIKSFFWLTIVCQGFYKDILMLKNMTLK